MGETGAGLATEEEITPGTALATEWDKIKKDLPWFYHIRTLIVSRPNLQPVGIGNNKTDFDISLLLHTNDVDRRMTSTAPTRPARNRQVSSRIANDDNSVGLSAVAQNLLSTKPIIDLVKKIAKLMLFLPETVPLATEEDDIPRRIFELEGEDGTVASTFNRRVDILFGEHWWENLEIGYSPRSGVLAMLAVHIYVILANSMPDERTNSDITWFNSPLQGNQKAENLLDMILVGQWHTYHAEGVKLLEKVKHKAADHSNSDSETDSDSDKESDSPTVVAESVPSNTVVSAPAVGEEPLHSEGEEADRIRRRYHRKKQAAKMRGKKKVFPSHTTFVVDPDINLRSAGLKELLSDEPSALKTRAAVVIGVGVSSSDNQDLWEGCTADDTKDLPDQLSEPATDRDLLDIDDSSDSDGDLVITPTLASAVKRKREDTVQAPSAAKAAEAIPEEDEATDGHVCPSGPSPIPVKKTALNAKDRFSATIVAEEETQQKMLCLKKEKNEARKEVVLKKIQMETKVRLAQAEAKRTEKSQKMELVCLKMEQEHQFRMTQFQVHAGPSSMSFSGSGGSSQQGSLFTGLYNELPTLPSGNNAGASFDPYGTFSDHT
ncbi:hypothetical protein B0H10DRAFT_2436356 [Mycena sp. CBHHK59/15]|nr:hypothetical protein B0H10DRAFT_2436356 [Mycena sp. CBHHK59/15]